MIRFSALALVLAFTAGCSSPSKTGTSASTSSAPESSTGAESGNPAKASKPDIAFDTAAIEAAGGVAYFAGGCFWGVEHFMEQIDGVLRVESGYMGGHLDDPSYEDVLSDTTGHLETVRIYFDPAKVGYEAVAKRFFEIHDPTQVDGQGPDVGPTYLSAIFVTDDVQRKIVEGLIARLEARGYVVATEIKPLAKFWIAEDYHQNYYVVKKAQPYCHTPVDRFGDAG